MLPFVHAEASELLDVLRVSSTITCGLGTGFRAEKGKIHTSMIILRAFYRQDIALKPVTAPIRWSALKLLRQRSR